MKPLDTFIDWQTVAQTDLGSEYNLNITMHNHVTRVLIMCHGNKTHAAKLLGISKSTLYRWLDRKYKQEQGDVSVA